MNAYNPFSLENKTILITGASSGIGRRTAIECSKMGANLIITGRNSQRLQETLDGLEEGNHQMMCADLTVEQDLKTLVVGCPLLDGVFLCAGIVDTTLVKFYNQTKLQMVFDTNYFSVALLTKELLSKKKLNKGASLVYMSSYGAEKVEPGLGIYSASKMAINALVLTVAKENVARKIRANAIMPMMIDTEMTQNNDSLSQEDMQKDMSKYPFGYGKPEDVAYAAIYLLSDASRWMTNSYIKMDGGSNL